MNNLFLPALIYVGFVAGGVLPFLAENDAQLAVRSLFSVLALGVVLRRGVDSFSRKVAAVYFIVSMILLLPLLLTTSNHLYAAQKIEALVLGVLFCFFLTSIAIRRMGWDGYRSASIVVAAIVLLLTIVYKIKFGFWDRDVRFFLNGPIVFGWLMGAHALFALMLWVKKQESRYLAAAVTFIIAVLWSQSKGPLLALGLCLLIMMPAIARLNLNIFRNLVFFCVAICVALVANKDNLLDLLEATRLKSIGVLATGGVQEGDEGSIGSRVAMLEEALKFISENAPFGIGVGEWPRRSNSGLAYPHNQHLEVLVEMGVPWFLLHVAFICFAFRKGGWELRIILLFFFIVSSLSGDVSYMRYLYVFALISIRNNGFRSVGTRARRVYEDRRISS